MTETLKETLTKINAGFEIAGKVAGVILAIGCFVFWIDSRIDTLESDHLTFKGVMDERTRNMQSDLTDIKDYILNLEIVPDGKSAKETENESPAEG